ncbi:hypothetical protein [Reyranella sp.]|uniref:hypothetical protein n=1 Tax=Reyranella sp. TaxID=1929291 RepID=UPI003D0F5EDB
MFKRLTQAAILAGSVLALGACTLGESKTAAAPVKPPAADYQAPVPPSPPAAQTRAICYNAADLEIVRSRMVQQELQVVTLQCQGPGGARAYEKVYADFVGKFRAEFATNARSLSQIASRKRFNTDVFVTEVANRTAQRAPTDKEFCSRGKRAFDWAMDPKVTALSQVPPPYDLGPEMNIYACPAQ